MTKEQSQLAKRYMSAIRKGRTLAWVGQELGGLSGKPVSRQRVYEILAEAGVLEEAKGCWAERRKPAVERPPRATCDSCGAEMRVRARRDGQPRFCRGCIWPRHKWYMGRDAGWAVRQRLLRQRRYWRARGHDSTPPVQVCVICREPFRSRRPAYDLRFCTKRECRLVGNRYWFWKREHALEVEE